MPQPAGPVPAILIASPDPPTTSQLIAALRDWRYPVETVGSGVEALQILTSATPPAIALLDAELSEMHGIEIVTELRRGRKRTTWIMLLSANPDGDFIRTCMDAGIDDFLLKPVDVADLRVRLRVAERVQALTSRLEQEAETAHHHATRDTLTGLWSRDSFLKILFQETDRVQRMKTPLTLLLLDLDGFSQVNHEYGYEAGDNVLRELASRFRRHLRSYDLVGRYGEDEFLLALPGCSSENAVAMTERMVQSLLQRPFDGGYEMISLTASIGMAQSRGRSPLVVLREAERALAEAKHAGRNCIRNYMLIEKKQKAKALQQAASANALFPAG